MGKKDKKGDRPVPAAPAGQAAPEFDMVFHCQLAHGSKTKQVRDFTNVKQLYESIANAFEMKVDDILYCTLNTHKVDMSRLLGGQIGLDDFLFAHVCGDTADVEVIKSGPALGLTISDNGAGYAFIKKIRADSIMAKIPNIGVGDHIAAINGKALKGHRHFEVARMLKDVDIGDKFTITRVSPKKAFDEMAKMEPRGQKAAGSTDVAAGSGKKTLRMKRDGSAVVEEVASDSVQKAIDEIDDMLDEQVGIRDTELSTTIYHLAKDCKDSGLFAGSIDEKLQDFAFPDDFVLDVWEKINP